MDRNNTITFKTVVDKDNYIVRDHTVYDIPIMPGVTFIDMIYRCLKDKNFDISKISLKNILFMEPISINGEEVKEIKITISFNDDFTGAIIAESALKDNETNQEWVLNLKADLYYNDCMDIQKIDIIRLIKDANEVVDLDKSYEFARQLNIQHKEFMKALGKLYIGADYLLAEVGLSDLAQLYLEDFILHPVYLDSSTIVPGYSYNNSDKEYEPAIPIYIKDFHASERLKEKKYFVYIDLKQCGADSVDIIHANIGIYSEDGVRKVCIDQLKSKRIRSRENLNIVRKEENENTDLIEIKDEGNYTREIIVKQLVELTAKIAKVDKESIKCDVDFYDQGMESVGLINMVQIMEKMYDQKFYPTLLFEYMNINSLADYLFELLKGKKVKLDKKEKSELVQRHGKNEKYDLLIYDVRSKLCIVNDSYNSKIIIPKNEKEYLEDSDIVEAISSCDDAGNIIINIDRIRNNENIKYAYAHAIIKIVKKYIEYSTGKEINLIVKSNEDVIDNIEFKALNGLIKTLKKEVSTLNIKLLFNENKQFVNEYKLLDQNNEQTVDYVNGGVYVITGGMGGLGRIIIRRIASLVNARIIIIGHSELNEEKLAFISEIEAMGSEVEYCQVDISDKNVVYDMAKKIEEKYSSINGVIHCAGVLKDSLVRDLKFSDFNLVCDTKINGLIGLDEAFSNQKLDFFVAFSSITALTGNISQSSYSYANSYMDYYMQYRDEMVKKHLRYGRSISINWTLWKDGGMYAPDYVVTEMQEQYNMGLLESCDGILAFEKGLAGSSCQLLVYLGKKDSFEKLGFDNTEIAPSLNMDIKSDDFQSKDIAIIGLSGKYPMADDLEEYWENLIKGKDCIQEIPAERWEWEKYYNSDKNHKGTSYSKWGGFIRKPSAFDPLFFNISPKDAELMDPQERLFLECSWNVLQDAGYTKKQIGHNVGVFVGVMWGQYQLIGIEEQNKGNIVSPNSFYSSVANRVSYWFDFTGPSMAVDTMCSSSLTAIHLACKSIIENECETAIVGGVNIIVHPSKYLFLSSNKMCSSDGKCRAFGVDGDGYVPGEGIGGILLKPLKKAIEDKDYIYGVIKGSAVNHGGKTSGFSVPNPKAQADVINKAYLRSAVDPSTISYIEAHGTGTALGDPIEIQGLSKVFPNNDNKKICIGSVKSNIGHLESAAGIAGVTKILLQMKHHMIVPSLYADIKNPHIDFEGSPFDVVTSMKAWNSETGNNLRSAVSAFGAGGSNAHIIIEEYKNHIESDNEVEKNEPKLFVLSANNDESLTKYVKKYIDYFENINFEISIKQLTYVLQNKREHMKYRIAFIFKNLTELKQFLKDYLETNDNIKLLNCYNNTELYHDAVNYIKGEKIDFIKNWEKKYYNMHLPEYPFLENEFWVETVNNTNIKYSLHPLINENISTLNKQCYLTHFTDLQYYINEHIVSGRLIIPGAVLLEMAKVACELSIEKKVRCIKDVEWKKSIALDDASNGLNVKTEVYINHEEVCFRIENDSEVFATGKCELVDQEDSTLVPNFDINGFIDNAEYECDITSIYENFSNVEIDYGPRFCNLKKIYRIDNKALSLAEIKNVKNDDLSVCDIHPLLIDAGFQTISSITERSDCQFLPYSIDRIMYYNSCKNNIYIYSELIDDSEMYKTYNISLYSENGEIVAYIDRFKVLRTDNKKGLLLFGTEQIKENLNKSTKGHNNVKNIIVVDNNKILENILLSKGYNIVVLNQGKSTKLIDINCYEVDFLSIECMKELIKELKKVNFIPDALIYGDEYRSSDMSFSPYFAIIKSFMVWKEIKELKSIYYFERKNECEEDSLSAAIEGFNKSVNQENNKIIGKVLAFDKSDASVIADEIEEKMFSDYVEYVDGNRMVSHYIEYTNNEPEMSFNNKTILITGGNGKLGLMFAEHFSTFKNVTLILCGRSALSSKQEEKINEIRKNGTIVDYIQMDITNRDDVVYNFENIIKKCNILNGIIHCAGTLNDCLLIDKSWDEFNATISPKITGLTLLDEVSKNQPLDFFTVFSSLASVTGSIGQTDYAYANSYLDHYMVERNKLVSEGKRYGRSMSINWPLWANGGMHMDKSSISRMKDETGIDILDDEHGIRTFDKIMSSKAEQIIVLYGNPEKIQRFMNSRNVQKTKENKNISSEEKNKIYKFVENYVIKLVAEEIKLSEDDISVKEPFERYGIDSIAIINMTSKLGKIIGNVPKIVFFEYNNIKDISAYFVEKYGAEFLNIFNIQNNKSIDMKQDKKIEENSIDRFETSFKNNNEFDEIAIIGISGQYPNSKNIEELWTNLSNGKDCITLIPEERWNNSKFYDESKRTKGKSYVRYGGFIEDIDKFDAMLFHISPKDAELIDPQERIFLQCAWNALEDSGYSAESLSDYKVGVFAGAMYSHYQLVGLDNSTNESLVAPISNFSSIANRVSFFFNFDGPSIAVDTMCSSALTALHLACESIHKKECDLAVVGGVNLSLHPMKYVQLCQGQFLSEKGACHSFGADADGYIPGEGVGAIIIKPLKMAEKDHDHIYGIIKSTSINHDGKTNGYAVPSPVKKADLVNIALSKAGINGSDINYVETHGTGTSLGDPIEISSLTNSIGKSRELHSCPIGSIKSNIGHLESCSGMASIAKVLLQFKYKMLVPSIHSEVLNENIDFDNSPFYVQRKLSKWQQPVKNLNNKVIEVPRCAAINAFGAGGSNACAIISEYNYTEHRSSSHDKYLFILSARTIERLITFSESICEYLKCNIDSLNFIDFIYTLQVGKNALDERFACCVHSAKELIKILEEIVEKRDVDNYCFGNRKNSSKYCNQFEIENESEYVSKMISQDNYDKLAELWVNGFDINWNELYKKDFSLPYRISLPTYPFEKKSYWITPLDKKEYNYNKSEDFELLDKNCSMIDEVKFIKTLSIDLEYIKDHVVNKKCMVPGAVWMEMALEAAITSVGKKATGLSDVYFYKGLIVNENEEIYISIKSDDSGTLSYETWQENNDYIYSEGTISYADYNINYEVDIDRRIDSCKQYIEHSDFYSRFDNSSFSYGEFFRNICEAWYCDSVVISRFAIKDDRKKYLINPALIDASFQSVSILVKSQNNYIPYYIKNMKIYNDGCSEGYIIAEKREDEGEDLTFDIMCIDKNNNLIFEIEGFVLRVSKFNDASNRNNYEILWIDKKWINASLKNEVSVLPDKIVKFIVGDYSAADSLNNDIIVYCREQYKKLNDNEYQIDMLNESNYVDLWNDIKKCSYDINDIVFSFRRNNVKTNALNEKINTIISPVLFLIKSLSEKLGKKGLNITIALESLPESEKVFFSAFDGLLHSMSLEYPKSHFKLIDSNSLIDFRKEFVDFSEGYDRIKYDGNNRFIEKLEQSNGTDMIDNFKIKEDKVFVITGGMGGLGLIFAKYLLEERKCKVALIGRSEYNDKIANKLAQMDNTGKRIMYVSADVCSYDNISEALIKVRDTFGNINGVIHAAGVIDDNLFEKKSVNEFIRVILPKILGIIYLDELTKDDPIELFCAFSSLTSILGNSGQTDYSYANAFMDEYIRSKHLVNTSNRKYLSINWPLWKNGGMQVSKNTEEIIQNVSGIKLLDLMEGIDLFEKCIQINKPNPIFLYGNKQKLINNFLNHEEEKCSGYGTISKQAKNEINQKVIDIISDILKIDKNEIFMDTELSELGFDSISYTDFSINLNSTFNTQITPNMFYEYNNIESVIDYIVSNYVENDIVGTDNETKSEIRQTNIQICINEKTEIPEVHRKHTFNGNNLSDNNRLYNKSSCFVESDIAIIGMSGKMPGADNLEEFWDKLINGRNLISKIPTDRWDIDEFYGNPEEEENKTNIIYGGFMKNVRSFDADFFGILPREAELMDPQQRLFIETVWSTIEDAGYRMSDLYDSNTGLFVGVASTDYEKVLNKYNTNITAQSSTGMAHSILANRISYLFNWHGPSEPIDTACSSSLVSIIHAIHSLWLGECDMAVAGGVNVMLDPTLFISFNKAGMLAKDGKCKTFDANADGYVRGEGVGAVLLKPLSRAIEDKDHIYAVIKGGAVNHGGKANSLTSPNTNAQAQLIFDSYKKADIDINTVTYIEAHGTGTSLGDPIEIDGLKKAFKMISDYQKTTLEKSFCGVGSVKSNVGHLETAAGIASLFKVVLSMKNSIIPSNQNFNVLNQYISLDNTPFYIIDKNTKWNHKKDKYGNEIPFRAGISSFGFGGVNSHIVLEEFFEQDESVGDYKPQIIVLSAKSKDSLRGNAISIYNYVVNNKNLYMNTRYIERLSYVLQLGREEFDHRIAFVANDYNDLIVNLEKIISNFDIEFESTKNSMNEISNVLSKNDLELVISHLIKEGNYDKIAKLWSCGFNVEWRLLHNEKQKKLSLPTYCFKKSEFWIKERISDDCKYKSTSTNEKKLIGEIDYSKSMYDGMAFTVNLDINNPVVSHHIINNEKVLAGMVQVELVLEALDKVRHDKRIDLKNIVFRNILRCDAKSLDETRVWLDKNNKFFITNSNYDSIFSQGEILVSEKQDSCEYLDINKFSFKNILDKDTLYNRFESSGMIYKRLFRNIKSVSWNENEALSLIEIDPDLFERSDLFITHPGIMDSALQTISVLWKESSSDSVVVPLGINKIEIRKGISGSMYAYAKKESDNSYNVVLVNDKHEVCVVFYGIILKEKKIAFNKKDISYIPVWKPIL